MSPPVELGGREFGYLLGLSSLSVVALLVVWRGDFDRVGLSPRALGLEYIRRGVLVAVIDRGLRLAISVRAPNGLDRPGINRLGPASDESAADPSVRIVRRGKALNDGAESRVTVGRDDEDGRRAVEVGRRRYRARLHDRFQIVLLRSRKIKILTRQL